MCRTRFLKLTNDCHPLYSQHIQKVLAEKINRADIMALMSEGEQKCIGVINKQFMTIDIGEPTDLFFYPLLKKMTEVSSTKASVEDLWDPMRHHGTLSSYVYRKLCLFWKVNLEMVSVLLTTNLGHWCTMIDQEFMDSVHSLTEKDLIIPEVTSRLEQLHDLETTRAMQLITLDLY